MHTFPRDIRATAGFAAGDLIDFIEKDDPGVFHPFDGQFNDLIHIDEPLRFLLHEDLPSLGDLDLTALGPLRQHGAQHIAQVEVHILHSGSGKNLDHGEVAIGNIELHVAVIERALLEELAEFLAGGIGLIGFFLRRLDLSRGFQQLILGFLLALGWQQNIQEFFLGQFFRFDLYGFQFFRTDHADRQFHEIADHGFHIPAYVADFGELAGLDFEKGRLSQTRQATRNLGFPHAGRSNHNDILGSDFIAQMFRHLLAAPAVPEGDGDHPFGVVLTDDEFVKLPNNLGRSKRLLHGLKAPRR